MRGVQEVLSSSDRHNPWREIYESTFLAKLLELQGRWAQSEVLLREAIGIWDGNVRGIRSGAYKHGRDIEWTALQRNELAGNLIQQDRLLDAETLLREALDIELRTNARYTKTVGILLNQFLALLNAQGRFDDVAQLTPAVAETWRKLLAPEDSRLRAETEFHAAAALAYAGDWRDAAQTLRCAYVSVLRQSTNVRAILRARTNVSLGWRARPKAQRRPVAGGVIP